MRTVRDIQNRQTAMRRRKAPCFTLQIEAEIRRKIVAEHGEILDSRSRHRIESKEYARVQACNRTVQKAQHKILRQKEKARLIREIRENGLCGAPDESPESKPSTGVDAPRKRGYREIVIEY
jgi:uncharacterized protein YhaN